MNFPNARQAAEMIAGFFTNRSCSIAVDDGKQLGYKQEDELLTIGIDINDIIIGAASPALPPEFYPSFGEGGFPPNIDWPEEEPLKIADVKAALFTWFCKLMNRHLIPYTLTLEIRERVDELEHDLVLYSTQSRTIEEVIGDMDVTPIVSWKRGFRAEFEEPVSLVSLITTQEIQRLLDLHPSTAKQSSSTMGQSGGFGFFTGSAGSP